MATLLETDIAHLSENIAQQYAIPAQYFEDQSIKRGLRNADGTGVLIGVSKVGSVQGYYMMDGERVPMPGKLYYRGISVEDIVEAHRKSGTFGYEEVAYLLLLGSLPTQAQQQRFNDVMARARTMPAGFTEDMILKAPSWPAASSPSIPMTTARTIPRWTTFCGSPSASSRASRSSRRTPLPPSGIILTETPSSCTIRSRSCPSPRTSCA